MSDLAASLTLHSHTSLNDALALPPSTATRFFEGKSFADWRKGREAELKQQSAVVERLNGVIRACGIVAKTVAKTTVAKAGR